MYIECMLTMVQPGDLCAVHFCSTLPPWAAAFAIGMLHPANAALMMGCCSVPGRLDRRSSFGRYTVTPSSRMSHVESITAPVIPLEQSHRVLGLKMALKCRCAA